MFTYWLDCLSRNGGDEASSSSWCTDCALVIQSFITCCLWLSGDRSEQQDDKTGHELLALRSVSVLECDIHCFTSLYWSQVIMFMVSMSSIGWVRSSNTKIKSSSLFTPSYRSALTRPAAATPPLRPQTNQTASHSCLMREAPPMRTWSCAQTWMPAVSLHRRRRSPSRKTEVQNQLAIIQIPCKGVSKGRPAAV